MLKWKSDIIIICFFLLLFGAAPCGAAEHDPQWVSVKIQELKDPLRSAPDKWKISREIQAAGAPALPLLIGCVNDPSPIGKTPATGGECINLPANVKLPQCQNPQWTETLGDRCQLLLYNMITPAYTSPYMTEVTSKQPPNRPFVIPDWKNWWEKYQNQSLEKIQQEARGKIDEFWLHDHKNSIVWK